MANSILVLGNSGEGKTTSYMPNEEVGIKGLNPEETFLFNVTSKPLPAKGWKKMYTEFNKDSNPNGNMVSTTNYNTITSFIRNIPTHKPHIKNIVIDDSNYLITTEFMSRASEVGFGKFNDIAANYYNLINTGINLPNNINFIVMAHTENSDGQYQLKSIGKMISEKITPEGYFTYCLVSCTKTEFSGETTYGFYTNRTMDNRGIIVPAKTPVGVFDDLMIPNDLGYVIDKIEKYNNGE